MCCSLHVRPAAALGRGGDCTLGEHNQADHRHCPRGPVLALLKGLPSPRILEEKSPKVLTRRSDCEVRRRLLAPAHRHLWPQHPQSRTSLLHYRQRYCNSNFKSSRPPLGDWLPHPWAIMVTQRLLGNSKELFPGEY